MKTIFLLHGHSAWDTGTTKTIDGKLVTESECVAKIVTNAYLRTRGLENTRVILVPRKKSLTELTREVNILCGDTPDCSVIEVHLNAVMNKSVDQIEVIYYKGSERSKAFAKQALSILQGVKGVAKGDKLLPRDKNENGGFLCYNVKPRAILLEYAYLSSDKYCDTASLNKMLSDYTDGLVKIIESI